MYLPQTSTGPPRFVGARRTPVPSSPIYAPQLADLPTGGQSRALRPLVRRFYCTHFLPRPCRSPRCLLRRHALDINARPRYHRVAFFLHDCFADARPATSAQLPSHMEILRSAREPNRSTYKAMDARPLGAEPTDSPRRDVIGPVWVRGMLTQAYPLGS
ncbi:hypothetical protein BD626DRAFT_16793 [Schizophyllum amplum]|uniref:Uncharacterized protein n=1 Tax=Schizophyllum amplum TaxID=97359 RepID=A0A550CY30_9AGAR|nr:hypothetical protein BD626DRAFT_16793 [Auriculariopsis ampla]